MGDFALFCPCSVQRSAQTRYLPVLVRDAKLSAESISLLPDGLQLRAHGSLGGALCLWNVCRRCLRNRCCARLMNRNRAGKLKNPLNLDCPDSRNTHPEHGVAQAVLGAVSRILSRRRRGTQKRELPSAAAQPIWSNPFSPAETIRPNLSLDQLGLTRKSARNRRIETRDLTVLFRGPALPSAVQLPWRLSSCEFGLVPEGSAQLARAWPSALPADLNYAHRLLLVRPPYFRFEPGLGILFQLNGMHSVRIRMWTLVGACITRFWIVRLESVHLPVGTRDGHA
ncbi:hypothetical protein CRG98_002695 [Punica granatum]|uniref:Uncharacterized protein n=1 Tax=Punica granatum TaxID=22663 RepID=A0A2I0L877_PUNGR|nr:hypothetical protein CRG98_002695 [Punica granatum]